MEPNEASPVVRLLDFTANFGNVCGIADSSSDFQYQTSLTALAQSNSVRACESSRSQVRSRPMAVPNLAMQNTRPPKRERTSSEQNNVTPKKKKHCNCKHSRCLKLYCECFLAQAYCDGCNCTNCFNKEEHADLRNEAIISILERNPQAFLPKIAKSPSGTANGVGKVQVEHKKGCKCKKSNCLKRYCECFQANVFCSDKCNCVDCKNSEESEERRSLFNERPSNTIMMQRAANAAINKALETTNKNRRNQGNHIISAASRSLPSFQVVGPPSTYRSPLSGILQAQHVNDFCTLLVELSTKAASTLSEAKKMNHAAMDIDMNEPPQVAAASTHEEDGIEDHRKYYNAMDSFEHRNTDDSNMPQDPRPLSPGTLALMCNERDTGLFRSDAHEPNTMELMNTASENGFDEIYIEQERLVLSTLRSFLNRLITCGSIEESKAERENS